MAYCLRREMDLLRRGSVLIIATTSGMVPPWLLAPHRLSLQVTLKSGLEEQDSRFGPRLGCEAPFHALSEVVFVWFSYGFHWFSIIFPRGPLHSMQFLRRFARTEELLSLLRRQSRAPVPALAATAQALRRAQATATDAAAVCRLAAVAAVRRAATGGQPCEVGQEDLLKAVRRISKRGLGLGFQ